MTSRRSLVRTIGGALAGSVALVGRSLAESVRSDRRGQRLRTGTASAPTAVTVRADRSAISVAGVPPRLAPFVEGLENRLDAVSLADIDRLAGSAGTDGTRIVDGTLVATGSFSARALGRELRRTEFTTVGTRAGIDRFVSSEGRLAVGVTRSTLVVGYGPGTALERVDAVRTTRGAVTATPRRPSPALGHIERVLDGNAVAAVDLSAVGRTRPIAVASTLPKPFADVVGAADAAGAAATVPTGRGRVGLRYALSADPARLSVDRVRTAIDDADTGLDTVRVDADSLERHGRTIVVDGDAPLERLFAAHAAAGTTAEIDRRRQSSAGWNPRSDETPSAGESE